MYFGRNKFRISIFVTCNRDARLVAFRKSGSLGIQVSGGNKSGIFVAAVKEGSPAYNEGLRKGDQILMVSNRDQVIHVVSLCEYHSDCLVNDFLRKISSRGMSSLDWLKPVVLFGSKIEHGATDPCCYVQSKKQRWPLNLRFNLVREIELFYRCYYHGRHAPRNLTIIIKQCLYL